MTCRRGQVHGTEATFPDRGTTEDDYNTSLLRGEAGRSAGAAFCKVRVSVESRMAPPVRRTSAPDKTKRTLEPLMNADRRRCERHDNGPGVTTASTAHADFRAGNLRVPVHAGGSLVVAVLRVLRRLRVLRDSVVEPPGRSAKRTQAITSGFGAMTCD